MKIKIKCKRELEFLEKIFTEVYRTTKENKLQFLFPNDKYIPSLIYDIAGKEIEVTIHKYTKEALSYNGFAFAYAIENVGTLLIDPSYVEKITEYEGE